MGIVRLVTAGSVDDGKSTLIGRLLYDAGALLEDQLSAVVNPSGEVTFANLTDGLKAEREQGITIDVAHKHFSSDSKRFLIADAPGHFEYIRNMVTAASTADAAILLVDAVQGSTEQTKRHALLAHLFGVSRIAVCVNKMDLADYDRAPFDAISRELQSLAGRAQINSLELIPVSALKGDNIIERSKRMPWYHGRTVLEFIDSINGEKDEDDKPLRFSVQGILRSEHGDGTVQRFYTGRVAAGRLTKGARVIALPSQTITAIDRIFLHERELGTVRQGASITVSTTDRIDVQRGTLLSSIDTPPFLSQRVEATICSIGTSQIRRGREYLLKHNHRFLRARIGAVHTRLSLNDFSFVESESLGQNEIGNASLTLSEPLIFDPYAISRELGGLILIDPLTNTTCAAGLLQAPLAS